MQFLPTELIVEIALRLRRSDYVALSSVSRGLRESLHSESAWKARISRVRKHRHLAIDDLHRLFTRIQKHRRDYARVQEIVRLSTGQRCDDDDARPVTTVAVVGQEDRRWLVAAHDNFWGGDDATVFTDDGGWWESLGRGYEILPAPECLYEAIVGEGRCAIVDVGAKSPMGHPYLDDTVCGTKRIDGFFNSSHAPFHYSMVADYDALLILPANTHRDHPLIETWDRGARPSPGGHWYLAWSNTGPPQDETREFAEVRLPQAIVKMRKEKLESFALLLHRDAPCVPRVVPKHPSLHRLAFAEDVF